MILSKLIPSWIRRPREKDRLDWTAVRRCIPGVTDDEWWAIYSYLLMDPDYWGRELREYVDVRAGNGYNDDVRAMGMMIVSVAEFVTHYTINSEKIIEVIRRIS